MTTAQSMTTHSPLLKNRPDIVETLTATQLRIVDLTLQGYKGPAIAKIIERSTNTVNDHIKAIFKKLQVKSRVHLVLLFAQEVKAS